MTKPFSAFVVAVLLTLQTLVCPPVSAQQPVPANAEFLLTTVQAVGSRRYTQTEIARVSGLEVGQSVTVAGVSATANRLEKSGLFKSVTYRYVTVGTQMTVTFEVVDSEWTVPVLFDNFVSFTDEELTAALRQEVPSFDGTAPALDGATDFIGRALQNLLAARHMAGRVTVVPAVNLKTRAQQYVFKVEPGPTLCALSIGGKMATADAEFVDSLRSPVGKDYSRSYLTSLSNGTLLDMYHRRGYWRATFAPPSVVVVQGATCTGVAVGLRVDEGVSYTWDRAEWIGNAVLASDDLNKRLQIRSGQVANGAQIDAELRRVHDAYGRQGYVLQTSAYAPRLDDSTRRAVFQFRVEEGPQFRMGSVEFAGISEGDARNLLSRWHLKSGDVYDASYVDEFRAGEVVAFQRRTRPPRTADLGLRLDEPQHLVDVRFVFK